jgi:hypothetical protein
MLQKTLLTTSALVLCVSIAFAGQKTNQSGDRISLPDRNPGLPVRMDHRIPAVVAIGHTGAGPVRINISDWVPGATFNNFSKDKNAEFLSWYAFATVNYSNGYSGDCSYYGSSMTASNAIPITGRGATVTKIKVPLVSLSGSQTKFNVGIYSATASGLPGSTELAGGSTTASDTNYCCTAVRSVDVNITLKAGQNYFLEVTCKTDNCKGGWDMEDTDLSGKAQDYFRYISRRWCGNNRSHHATSSSPWHLSTQYPEQGAAIVK